MNAAKPPPEIEPSRPLVEELAPAPDAEGVFLRLASRRHCIWFDSAMRDARLGRYSFIAAEPFEHLCHRSRQGDPLGMLSAALQAYPALREPGLPPFQGGAAGLLSYDLGSTLESLPAPGMDEFGMPVLSVGLYDVVFAFDHETNQAWIVSQGFPELEPKRRRAQAEARLREARGWLAESACQTASNRQPQTATRLASNKLAEQFSVSSCGQLTSNFSHSLYLEAVQRAIDYIYAGDIFQVNLAQRLLHPAVDDAVTLYRRLRRRNPATFAGYYDLGDMQICSASPERFLSVLDRQVEARPIKGTRARRARPEADLFAGDDLKQSEKDRAENVMIVDLLRNDLSRACDADSIHVPQLCGLEAYAYVQHLVSVVQGALRDETTAIDVMRGAFPGGSITGAPKIRAMEIIAELEPTARGAYCGSLAYFGFDGSTDTSILIRTITVGRGWWQLPVGGGIVAQSSPRHEYEETWHKAEGMLQALR